MAALVLRRPELVALAAPFGLIVVLGLARAERPELAVALELDGDRFLEGQLLHAAVAVTARRPLAAVGIGVDLPEGLAAERVREHWLADLHTGDERRLDLPIRCRRWGAYRLGPARVRTLDRFGLLAHRFTCELDAELRVYPTADRLRSVVAPRETQPHAGNLVSRRKGEGIEFADIRPFVAGDRVRAINWRASSRRNALFVNDRHPEQNSDVILFLDGYSDVRWNGTATLDLTVRAAASLASAYLKRRDRVGVVGFGGTTRTLLPSAGALQLYRIVEALLHTQYVLSYAWKDIDVIPARTLPPQALVLAVSPLLDERTVHALVDLRHRGFDLVVVDISPLAFVGRPRTTVDELAYRVWALQREALHFRYESLGVPVVEWDESRPLQAAIEEARWFRRYAVRAHA